MKKLMYYAVVLLTMGLAACSSDNDTPQEARTVNLAPSRASEVAFYSNGNKLDANGQIVEASKTAKSTPFYITRADDDKMPDAVEVNFSINERDAYPSNDTKLSIHVRSVSDVTVFIPTPAEYYCPADDMQIVMAHYDNTVVYSTEEHAEMDVNGNKVKLDITFAENGITVKTSGMNRAVQDYLLSRYGDGLTFEVCNYFNTQMAVAGGTKEISHQDLKKVLEGTGSAIGTTISFTHTPEQYAYAYGLLKGNATAGEKEVVIVEDEEPVTYHVRALDCKVVPANADLFQPAVTDGLGHGHTSYLYTYTRK